VPGFDWFDWLLTQDTAALGKFVEILQDKDDGESTLDLNQLEVTKAKSCIDIQLFLNRGCYYFNF